MLHAMELIAWVCLYLPNQQLSTGNLCNLDALSVTTALQTQFVILQDSNSSNLQKSCIFAFCALCFMASRYQGASKKKCLAVD